MTKQELKDYIGLLTLEPEFGKILGEIIDQSTEEGEKLQEKIADVIEEQAKFYTETATNIREGK